MTTNDTQRSAGMLNRIRDYFTPPAPTPTEAGLEKLRRLGADIPARLEDAALLDAAGVRRDLVAWIAVVAATGRLAPDAFVRLPDLGVNTAPTTDWITRRGLADSRRVREEVVAAAVEETSRSSVAWGALSAGDRTAPIEAATHLREVATVAANAALRALDEAVSGR